ncbi:endonuclease/exonuclease/phosphatase family protein [Corallococcus sp. CA053C]|nr:endonuclease/exonuclease/phosphatase family protein [Corallococcus sp. CA053C]
MRIHGTFSWTSLGGGTVDPITLRIGTWNLMRGGAAKGRAGRIVQFVLDWFNVKAKEGAEAASNIASNMASPFVLLPSSGGAPEDSLGGRFVESGLLLQQPTLGVSHPAFPSHRYVNEAPESKLTAHGFRIQNPGVDIVFLTEIRGELSEVGKLLTAHAASDLVHSTWDDASGHCSIMAVARVRRFTFMSLAKKAVRGIKMAVPTGLPVVIFGCHAKSGGSHETQADLALLLSECTEHWRLADGSLTSLALAIGDFNTEPPDPRIAPAGFSAVREHSFWSEQHGPIRWRAWHPGVVTHCPSKESAADLKEWSTLDYLWSATGASPVLGYNVTSAHPLEQTPRTYSALRATMSDHAPVGFNVTLSAAKKAVPSASAAPMSGFGAMPPGFSSSSMSPSFAKGLGAFGSSSPVAPVATRRTDRSGRNPIVSYTTTGHGDCGIHAIYGKPQPSGEYGCPAEDVARHRKTIGASIRTLSRDPEGMRGRMGAAYVQMIAERLRLADAAKDNPLWKNLGLSLASQAWKAIGMHREVEAQATAAMRELVPALLPYVTPCDAAIDVLVLQIEGARAPSATDQDVRTAFAAVTLSARMRGASAAGLAGEKRRLLRDRFRQVPLYALNNLGAHLGQVWEALTGSGVDVSRIEPAYRRAVGLANQHPLTSFIERSVVEVFDAYARCTETQGYYLQHLDLIRLSIANNFTLVFYGATSPQHYGAVEQAGAQDRPIRHVLLTQSRDHYEYTQPG